MPNLVRTYVVAVKRDSRTAIAPDWVETVRHINGVTLEAHSDSPRRIVVHANEDAANRIREALPGQVLVEEAIAYTIAERLADR